MVGVSTQPGIKPMEAVVQIFGLTKEESLKIQILKTAWRAMDAH